MTSEHPHVTQLEESQEIPPAGTENRLKILKRLITVMTVLLIAGVGLLIYKILDVASTANKKKTSTALSSSQQNVSHSTAWRKKIPLDLSGHDIKNLALEGDYLLVQTAGVDGVLIYIVDLKTGQIISQISSTAIQGAQ